MKLSDFFNLIRYKNLILIAYLLLLIHFVFLPSFDVEQKLNTYQFFCLFFSILFISSAGYIINDIFDVKVDLINKPKKVIVSKKIAIEKAKVYYRNINSIGLFLGIVLSIGTQNPSYSFVFICASFSLYWYSKYLKSKPFIGNFMVSLLTAITIPITLLFDIDSFYYNEPYIILLLITLFAFVLSLIREIIKDIEDVNGDKKLLMNTLPIIAGRKRAKFLVIILLFICIFSIAYLSISYAADFKYAILYLIVTVFIPLTIIAFKLLSLKNYSKIHIYSTAIKIIMFMGINSILILAFA